MKASPFLLGLFFRITRYCSHFVSERCYQKVNSLSSTCPPSYTNTTIKRQRNPLARPLHLQLLWMRYDCHILGMSMGNCQRTCRLSSDLWRLCGMTLAFKRISTGPKILSPDHQTSRHSFSQPLIPEQFSFETQIIDLLRDVRKNQTLHLKAPHERFLVWFDQVGTTDILLATARIAYKQHGVLSHLSNIVILRQSHQIPRYSPIQT